MFYSAASSCLCRLCWVQGGDQTRPVASGTGQAVARQLLQMPDLQRHPHRGVHQQVGLPLSLPQLPGLLHSSRHSPFSPCLNLQQYPPSFPSTYHTSATSSISPAPPGPPMVFPLPEIFSVPHVLTPSLPSGLRSHTLSSRVAPYHLFPAPVPSTGPHEALVLPCSFPSYWLSPFAIVYLSMLTF